VDEYGGVNKKREKLFSAVFLVKVIIIKGMKSE